MQVKYKINNSNSLYEKKKVLYSKLVSESIPFNIEFEMFPYNMGKIQYTIIRFVRMIDSKEKSNSQSLENNPNFTKKMEKIENNLGSQKGD